MLKEEMPAEARRSQQNGWSMRTPILLFTAIAALMTAGPARSAEPVLTAALAEKMAGACIAYAKDHNGAVNIWIYNEAGELLHLQRMDGAPPMPPLQEFQLRDGFGFDANREIAGGVSIRLQGRIVGTAKATGLGAAGDLACALAAAKAGE